MLVVFGFRQRMAKFEEREAAGENVWTTEFSRPARIRIEAVVERWFKRGNGEDQAEQVDIYLREHGFKLKVGYDGYADALLSAVRGETDDFLPSLVDAVMAVAQPWADVDSDIKRIFEEERLAYRVVNRRLVPFDSLELHENVIVPTLRLLAGRDDLANVEEGYESALKEIGTNPADAITDAGRALQAMLTAIGCDGNSIGAQLKDAKRKKLLAAHDETLTNGIDTIIHWVSADRSEKGDAHKAATVSPEDAWFTVHVVGALIVRLAEGPRA
jgi:hypothetical protein